MRPNVVLLSTLLFIPALSAQTTRVSPHYCTDFEGSGSDQYLAGREDLRMQVLYLGSQVASGPGAIATLAFRRDGDDTNAYKPWTVYRRILLDHCQASPDALSGTFAANLSPAAQKVFESATLLFPPMPAPTFTPAPFTAVIPLSQPFLFDPAKGNLLMDVMGQVSALQGEWKVDSQSQTYGLRGLMGVLGPGCTGSGSQGLQIALDTNQLYLGGSLSLSFTHTIAQPSVLLAWIGLSWNAWGGVPLPIDLAFLGAPNCGLQVSMDLVTSIPAAGGAFPPLSIGIKDPALVYGKIGLQALAVAPGANAAGLLFSGGLKAMVWPDKRPATVLSCVFNTSSTALTGSISRTPFGPVTRFQGNLP